MRLLRSLAFGLLAAGGAHCVGFVACRLGHEIYPYAGPVFDALLPGWVAVASVTGGFYGYYSRNTKLRSLVLATTFIVTLTSFYAMAVRLIDEHHETALRKKQESLQMLVRLIGKSAPKRNRCEWTLLQERFAMNGDLTPNDAAFTRHYCSGWGRSIKSAHDPIEELWEAFDEEGRYPVRRENDDA